MTHFNSLFPVDAQVRLMAAGVSSVRAETAIREQQPQPRRKTMFDLSQAWHWVGVHGHNFVIETMKLERSVVGNRVKIEKVEQDVANITCTALSIADPAAALALMKIIPGFSAAFAKCLDALAKINTDSGSNIVPMEFDADFVNHLQIAALALEQQKPGSTTPPAFLFPTVTAKP